MERSPSIIGVIGGIDREAGADFVGQRLDGRIVVQVLLHQHVGEGHLHARGLQQPGAGDRALERSGDQGDRVVDFRPMRVDADLHPFDAQRADAPGLRLLDQDGVGLDLDREHQPARVLEDVEQIRPEEDLAAADGEEEDAGGGELIEQILDLGECHLAVIVVIEITVHAPLVAAVGEVELRAERDAKAQRPGTHLPHQ